MADKQGVFNATDLKRVTSLDPALREKAPARLPGMHPGSGLRRGRHLGSR